MLSRSGKFLLLLLVPAAIYGGLKGVLYYNAKQTVDDLVSAASYQADIRYADITTDLRGAVTVSGVTVQPVGYADAIKIDAVRIASDDPLFFIRSADWRPGEDKPPEMLEFAINGVHVPLNSDFVTSTFGSAAEGQDAACAQGLQIEPGMLRKLGFDDLDMDFDGYYRLDPAQRTLSLGVNMELRDIESMHFTATLADVDVQTLAQGGAPQVSLGDLKVALTVSPKFGRQALKECAIGTEMTVQEWSTVLAERAVEQFEGQGLSLGYGLRNALRDFYRDWGEFKLVAAPAKPVGLFSLIFLPPERLAEALSLQLSLNDQPIGDASFTWHRPDAQALSALFGAEQADTSNKAASQPRRILIRRDFEPVPVGDIGRYVDHKVTIKPRGQPLREGVLKRINDGEAEVEQSLHGGKFTVYVPLRDIESVQALVQREISPPR